MNAGTSETWVVATDTRRITGMVSALRPLGGPVRVVAVGQRSLAEAAARTGPDAVSWVEPADEVPPEAYAALLAAQPAAVPQAVLSGTGPADRALLGAVAVALGAVVVPGVLSLRREGETVVVERSDLGGRVVETLASTAPVAGLYGGEDPPSGAAADAAPITALAVGDPADVRLEKTEPIAGANAGLGSAERVVAVGRGLKARADLALVEDLAETLGAVVGCSMPVADDFGWMDKDRYLGRSGRHIAPRLYVAVGISGAPQHLDGVRDAKVVVAVNADRDAHIFAAADYGIVGDLYEVLPELQKALTE